MKSFIQSFMIAAVLAVTGAASAADAVDPIIGTWTMNAAKSTFAAGHELKSQTRTYAQTDEGVTVDVKGETASGGSVSQHALLTYDGKSHPMTGSPDYDALSLKRVNGSTVKSNLTKGGKPVGSSVRTVSMHGKVMTLTSNVKDASGKPYTTKLVFDKQ